MDIQVIFNQMAVLFILMAVGFVVGKLKVLTPDNNKTLTRFVLFIALPCTIISSVFDNEISITLGDTTYFLLMSFLSILIAFLISLPVVRLMGGEKANRGLLNFMSVFSNCGFMGFPVVIAIFGASSAYYVALFNIAFNALVFSVGIIMISGKNVKFDLKLLINPSLISAIIAIPIALTGIRPPQVVVEAISITGSITSPGAMIIIGSILAYVPLKTVFSEWRIVPVTLLKLVVVPLLTWLVLRQIITNELLLGVLVVISGMPVAAMSSMLAVEYDGNEPMASAGVFLSTLLCGVTVPLIVYLLLA